MIWLLLTALILLAQQFYFLRQDYQAAKTENRILERLATQRYTHLKLSRRRLKSVINQARIWSKRALDRGFSRREHKDALRHARQLRKQGKLYLVPPTDNNQT